MIQVLGGDMKSHNLNQCLLAINRKPFGAKQALSFFLHIFFVATPLKLLLKTIKDEMNHVFDTS